MASLPHSMRQKGPQPVIDSLQPEDSESIPEPRLAVPYMEAPRNSGLREPTVVPRSSTFALSDDDEHMESLRPLPTTNGFGRPKLLRAQTDVGPHRENGRPDHGDGSDIGSAEMEWGIRHGFDTQLGSEEYNTVLTSVSVSSIH
jgi:hypothetical protein